MFSNGVHHDAECQDVATHDEDGEQQLANAKQLTPECPHQDLASIGKVLDVRIAVVELRNDQPGIGGKQAQADNQDDGPAGWRLTCILASFLGVLTAQDPAGQGLLAMTAHQEKQTPQS